MKRFSKLINLPVLCKSNGTLLGRISDVFFDVISLNIVGYIVSIRSIIPISHFLKSENILKIDKNCFWVKDKNVFISVKDAKKNKNYKSFQKETEGKEVIENGGKIGTISDIVFKMEFGEITHFEISNGFTEDILNGRKNINANKEIIFGNNNVEITDKGV